MFPALGEHRSEGEQHIEIVRVLFQHLPAHVLRLFVLVGREQAICHIVGDHLSVHRGHPGAVLPQKFLSLSDGLVEAVLVAEDAHEIHLREGIFRRFFELAFQQIARPAVFPRHRLFRQPIPVMMQADLGGKRIALDHGLIVHDPFVMHSAAAEDPRIVVFGLLTVGEDVDIREEDGIVFVTF